MQTGREEIEPVKKEIEKFCISHDPLPSDEHTVVLNVTVIE